MRRTLYTTAVLLLLGVISLAGCAAWLTCSSAGARWLLQVADGTGGINVSAERLEGTLLGELQLENLQVSWFDGQFLVSKLSYDIRSIGLFPPRIELDLFQAERPILRLGDEDADAEGEPVGIEVIPDWLSARIETLEITDFLYQELNDHEDEVVIADLIAGSYQLTDQLLTGSNFAYHSPYVHLDGEFQWQLARPHLVMDARVLLPETVVDPELFETIRVPRAFPAQLELDGDWNHYAGPARFGTVEDDDVTWLSTQVDGSWRGIRIKELIGGYLGGSLAGDIEMTWIDDYRLHGNVSAEELDPAELVENLAGLTSFAAIVELYVPYDDQPVETRLDVEIGDSTLQGYPLHGRAAGELRGADLVSLDLDLSTENSHLLASGVVAEKVMINVSADDLSRFYPDLQGRLFAEGWLCWAGDSLTGELAGWGDTLFWQDISVESLQFQGSHLAAGEAMTVAIDGQNWRYGDWSVDRGTARLDGDADKHHVSLVVESPDGQVEADLSGHYQPEAWRGTIDRLIGQSLPFGNWSNSKPAQITWQDGTLSLIDLQLRGENGGKVDARIDSWGGAEETGYHLVWNEVDVGWLQGILGLKDFDGRTSGELTYQARGAQPLLIDGRIAASGKVADDYYDLSYEELSAQISWGEEGLQLASELETATGEYFSAQVSSSEPPQWSWPPKELMAELSWQELKLERLNRFLENGQLTGESEGSAHLEITDYRPLRIGIHASAEGRILEDEVELGPRRLAFNLHWSEERFRGTAQIEGMLGGKAWLSMTSEQKPAFAWPASGEIEMEIDDLNLASLEPLLPEDVDLKGVLTGNAQGRWFEQQRFSLAGSLQFQESQLLWESVAGQVRVPVDDARFDWQWQDSTLEGAVEMVLGQQSYLQGEWRLPVAARVPLQIDEQQPLSATLDCHLEALGALSSIGPWLVQEYNGEWDTMLSLEGTWNKPALSGDFEFSDGSAYLPLTGIQLEDVAFKGDLDGNRIRFSDVSIRSGPGEVSGAGELVFEGWQLANYELTVAGEEFQLLNFPEVNLLVTPDLVISGRPQGLSMKGTVHIPTLTIRSNQLGQGVQPSKDVVLPSVVEQTKADSLDTDVRVVVSLGDEVTVKTVGVDTRLEGGAVVTMDATGEFKAWGDILLVSGVYSGYGAKLKIRQGALHYAGDSILNPQLKIFAARQVGLVLAGVQLTGTADVPVVTLYSQPAMPERDVIGYIFMGRAIGSEAQDSDAFSLGAGALMSGSDSGGGLEALGITEIDLQGLFVGSGGVRVRQRIKENWEVESTFGPENGLDLFYVIEFD